MFDYARKKLARKGAPAAENYLANIAGNEVQKFLIDNVRAIMPEKIRLQEIPRIAPPYPKMWFEWDVCLKFDAGEDLFGMNVRQGVYVEATKTEIGWDTIFLCFTRSSNILIPLPLSLRYVIPRDGRIPEDGLDSAYGVNGSSSYLLPKEPGGLEPYSDRMFVEFIVPIFFTFGLLHCKNIVAIEKGGRNPNVKNRRHRSKGTKHYVLDVIPSQNIHRTEYERPAQGSAQRMHFRRGHFKEYTAEKPLFGKYIGSYWWEAHVAGSANIGEIRKDYRILPMQQEQQAGRGT
jgi:hypothetical protein